MIIKIANLSEGVHELSFDEKVPDIGIEEPFFGKCKVDINLAKSHSQIVLNANMTLTANYECDRCSREFIAEVRTNYQMVYLFGNEPEENDNINLSFLPHDADKIDITKDVRDYALLAVPMKRLCKEDCKGLCIKCGKDLNEEQCSCKNEITDDRWKPLIDLKNKLN